MYVCECIFTTDTGAEYLQLNNKEILEQVVVVFILGLSVLATEIVMENFFKSIPCIVNFQIFLLSCFYY